MVEWPSLRGPNEDGIFQLCLGNDQNRFDAPYFKRLIGHLAAVEQHEGPTALVVCSDSPKFFSNGLSFESLAEDSNKFLNVVHEAWLHILTVGVPTIAAVSGHAFAGGAMVAFCCDYRVMNQDKGFICINEVELGFPLTPGLAAVVKAKADRSQWTKMMLQAKRYSGPEALSAKLVDAIAPPDKVLEVAMELAKREVPKGENKRVYRSIKEEAFYMEVAILKASAMGHADGFAERIGLRAKL